MPICQKNQPYDRANIDKKRLPHSTISALLPRERLPNMFRGQRPGLRVEL